MPWFRCTDPECGHRWFHNSILDETPDCEACGEETEMFDPDDEEMPEFVAAPVTTGPRISVARELARKRITDAGISSPPVPVRELAEAEGLKIVLRTSLGTREIGSDVSGRDAGDCLPAKVRREMLSHEDAVVLNGRCLRKMMAEVKWPVLVPTFLTGPIFLMTWRSPTRHLPK